MPGKVAEQDPQVGVRVRELPRPRPSSRVAVGVRADELDPGSRVLDDRRLVAEQDGHLREAVQLRRARERIARDRDVVVPEDDERPLERAAAARRGAARRADARRGRR